MPGWSRAAAAGAAAALYEIGNRLGAGWRGAARASISATYACESPGPAGGAALLDEPLRLSRSRVGGRGGRGGDARARAPSARLRGFRRPDRGACSPPRTLIAWAARYVRWELDLLAELGFGLDLGSCAISGATTDLAFVSPMSGRAVSAARGGTLARAPAAAAGLPDRGRGGSRRHPSGPGAHRRLPGAPCPAAHAARPRAVSGQTAARLI